ncbi:MAG: hypothetical protein ISS79_03925 [Phycisphaerae bacterium]|nr:hypothetical protein [Phycisphaerae bacterium]
MKDIYENKAGSLINKLVGFLGEPNVKRCLQRHERSLKSAGPIFREYYLKKRHPWLSALEQYYELTNKAKSIHKHLTPELQALAIDAKKVIALQNKVSDSVKKKYKRVLLDSNHAHNYLFEIHVAWHFFANGHDIQWYEDDSSKQPEFIVKLPGLQFNVECKRISVDIARKIHRKDFYGFADKLIPEIEKINYAGRLDIILEERLKSSNCNKLCMEVMKVMNGGMLQGDCEIAPFGSLALDMSYASGVSIDMNESMEKLYERKADEACGAIFARSEGGKPVDPIELTVMSKKADEVLDTIKDRISEAAEEQLDVSKPGLIACFLEGIDGFELHKLRSNSGLQVMTNYILDKDEFSHIAGISYSSESMVKKGSNYEEIFNAGLFFRNHKCKFEEAKTFTFISPPKF